MNRIFKGGKYQFLKSYLFEIMYFAIEVVDN